MTTEEEGDFWLDTFCDSTGNEVGLWAAILACLIAEKRLKEGCDCVWGGGTGMSGTPKAFFTPGTLSTTEGKKNDKNKRVLGIIKKKRKKEKKKSSYWIGEFEWI